MKHLKCVGLVALSAMSLMAFLGVGSASATFLTSPLGTTYKGPVIFSLEMGTTTVLHTSLKDVTCTEGIVEGEVEEAGSGTSTVKGPVRRVTAGNCNCEKVEVTKGGTLEAHTQNNDIVSNGNGTLTWNGATLIITCSGITCRYITENSHIGTLTGSINTGTTATMDIDGNWKKHEVSSFLCSSTATWEAKYFVTTPDYLDVD